MGHAAGSEGWVGHYLTWFVPGVGGIFSLYLGVSIDRCIKVKEQHFSFGEKF